MSVSMYRRQLEQKQKALADAGKKAGEFGRKESDKRAAASKAKDAAAKKKSASLATSKLREASRHEAAAHASGKSASDWRGKAAKLQKEISGLQAKLAKAEQRERDSVERKRRREQVQAEQRAAAEQATLTARVEATEGQISTVMGRLPKPKPEKLRVLMLAASSAGDLRVGREQRQIRVAVERATHREQIEFDVRTAATGEDLLDGITRFRPHVVHFSGHGDENLIVFEEDVNARHAGAVVSAEAFARAVAATDEPPLLIVLNACHSAAQIDDLVDGAVAPFAIGMSDSIGDDDAIHYAARFYAALANGQSLASSHASGAAAISLAGLPGEDLPTLAWADDVDPQGMFLVQVPE